MAILRLTGSVGKGSSKKGIPHNEPADVIAVRNRFVELGYHWVGSVTNGKDKDFTRLIRFFQSICKGRSKFDSGDGRIDLHGNTHRWLAAQNAPGWVNMTGMSGGIGWSVAKFDHGNSWTTTWMLNRVNLAGLLYRGLCLANDVEDCPPMWIRDSSKETGGKTRGHGSHQTGLDLDMRLPLLPPDTDKFDQLHGKDYDRRFHRDAALLQVRAIKETMLTRFIFFNDPEFRKKGLSTFENNHSEHYHIRIKPPERIEGVYM